MGNELFKAIKGLNEGTYLNRNEKTDAATSAKSNKRIKDTINEKRRNCK